MKMTNQKDTSASLLFWGPPFSGKTVLASQFPDPHFIALDKHTLTSVRGLRNRYSLDFDVDIIELGEKETTDPDFIKLVGSAVFAKASAWEKTLRLIEAWCRTLPENATLVIDNLSRIGEDLTRMISKQSGKQKFTFDEWGAFLTQMQKMIECINHDERKCNVIIIGHEKPDEDQITGEIRRYLLLPGQARYRIPSTITDYLYIKAEQKIVGGKRVSTRMLRSRPTNDAQTGSRTLLPNIEYPTYKKMRPYLEAALGRAIGEPNWTPPEDE